MHLRSLEYTNTNLRSKMLGWNNKAWLESPSLYTDLPKSKTASFSPEINEINRLSSLMPLVDQTTMLRNQKLVVFPFHSPNGGSWNTFTYFTSLSFDIFLLAGEATNVESPDSKKLRQSPGIFSGKGGTCGAWSNGWSRLLYAYLMCTYIYICIYIYI